MALSDEGITVNEAEIKFEFSRVNARLGELEGEVRALSAYVRGNADMGAPGLASQVTQIAQNVKAIMDRLNTQDAKQAEQKRILGLFGVRDFVSFVSFVATILTLIVLIRTQF
jgi:hypothetical protein